MKRDVENKWKWKREDSKQYTVSSAYEKLVRIIIGENPKVFELFWKVNALSSTQTLAWRVLLNKVVTMDNLTSKKIRTQNETIYHLFLECTVIDEA